VLPLPRGVYREVDEELELYEALGGLGDSLADAIAARRAPRPATTPTAATVAGPTSTATTPSTPLELGREEPKPRASGSIRRVAGELV
jgi:hypothetical protein